MFGTNKDIFGDGRFGETDWGRITIYESLPVEHRRLDALSNDPLKKMFGAFQTELELLRDKIGRIPMQRDPLVAQNGDVYVVSLQSISQYSVNVIEIVSVNPHRLTFGDMVMFSGTDCTPPLIDPLSVIQIVSDTVFRVNGTVTSGGAIGQACLFTERGSLLQITGWREYDQQFQVNYEKDQNMIEFDVDPRCDLSKIGVGYKCLFQVIAPIPPLTNRYKDADIFSYRILRVTRRESPQAQNKILCVGSILPNQATADTVTPPITMLFKQQSVLDKLAGDFGIKFDDDDPVDFKRSQIKNAVEYIARKASPKGYEIRSNTAGFEIDVQGLHFVCGDALSDVPPNRLYEIDGTYYTDYFEDGGTVSLSRFTFDDVAADVSFVDPEDGMTYNPMDARLVIDGSADGRTPQYTFSLCMREVEIAFTRATSATENATYGILDGVVVTVNWALADDRFVFGTFDNGSYDFAGPIVDPYGEYLRMPILKEISFGGTTGEYLIDISSIDLPDLGQYCIRYMPASVLTNDMSDCCVCKSYAIRLILTPTEKFKEETNFSGRDLIDAVNRLVERLRYEQVPIHAEIKEVVLNLVNIDITIPDFAITIGVDRAIVIPVVVVERYDTLSADNTTVDSGMRITTVTVT